MHQQFDEASYQEGRAAFNAGASLRSIVEACATAGNSGDEAKAFSGALGFADALLDFIRHPIVVGNLSKPIER